VNLNLRTTSVLLSDTLICKLVCSVIAKLWIFLYLVFKQVLRSWFAICTCKKVERKRETHSIYMRANSFYNTLKPKTKKWKANKIMQMITEIVLLLLSRFPARNCIKDSSFPALKHPVVIIVDHKIFVVTFFHYLFPVLYYLFA